MLQEKYFPTWTKEGHKNSTDDAQQRSEEIQSPLLFLVKSV